jgi:hypothetical protein
VIVSKSVSWGRKTTSASESTNFLITQGQAIRSTFALSRVTHLMTAASESVDASTVMCNIAIVSHDCRDNSTPEPERRWLLLIHQIPPKPDYLRVKIWRRLQRVGAVAIKNSVYVMPRNDQSLEDLQWTVREITEGGGDAWICEAGFVEGISNDQVEGYFGRRATLTTPRSVKRPRSSPENLLWEKGTTKNAPVSWELAWSV